MGCSQWTRGGEPGAHVVHERSYSRSGVTVPVRLNQRTGNGPTDTIADINGWYEIIRATLDVLPTAHLALLGSNPDGHIWVWHRPARGGAEPLGGMGLSPHVWMNRDVFQSSFNQQGHSMTLMHEMGHQVECWRQNRGAGRVRTTRLVERADPAGCLAMLHRPHGSSTRYPGEHYAYVYSDYFYTQVCGHSFSQADQVVRTHTGDASHPCGQLARRCRAAIARTSGVTFPGTNPKIVQLRYAALLRSEPFVGLGLSHPVVPTPAPAATSSAPPPAVPPAASAAGATVGAAGGAAAAATGSQTDTGIAPHAAVRVPCSGPGRVPGVLGRRE